MRARTLLLVLATAVVVVFALLNWTEFTRPVPVNLGLQTVSAPLPLILLGLLALGLLVALAGGAASQAHQRRLESDHAKALQAQRDLAERAEASRFVDLRQALDTHLRETRQRESSAAGELDQALAKTQREVRNQMELLHRSLNTRLGEMEARLEQRLSHADREAGRMPAATPRTAEPVRPPDFRSDGTPVAAGQPPLRRP